MAAGLAMAQPGINSIQNAASNIPPPLPNSPIAQGATFVVKGSGLGPANILVANFPYPLSLSGTSVKVTVGGQTRDCIMYYTLNVQIAAILPSSTPLGTGTLTVTYNGQTSAPSPITVVANNLGLYTLSSSGAGAAVATFQVPPPNGPYVSNGNAAIAGDSVILWGTGLGAIAADESIASPGGDMTNVPLEVFVGGQPATILYRGRNGCCSSVDTVYFRVPAGVAGCVTPVTMKIGSLVSNTVTIPIASSGRVCTPSNPGISQNDLSAILAKGSYTTGSVLLTRSSATTTTPSILPGIPATTTTVKNDTGSAGFFRVTGDLSTAFNSQFESVSFGSCAVYSYSGQTIPTIPLTTAVLDAGPSIGVNGAKGAKSLPKVQGAGYFSVLSATADYLDPGAYTLTGTGGADLGAFSAQTTVPPTLVWTNQAGSGTVNRANGLPVTWTGGDPNGNVQITGSSFVIVGTSSFFGASFVCTARTTDGAFTVPSIVLLALPPSGSISAGTISLPLPGTLGVAAASSSNVKVAGLDFFSVGSQMGISQSATYQ